MRRSSPGLSDAHPLKRSALEWARMTAVGSAAGEGDEGPERRRQGWSEGHEGKALRGVEACFLSRVEVDEGQERVDGLIDRGPAEGSLIAVVVRRSDALGDALDAGDGIDRAAGCWRYVAADDAREGAMVALDAHDARGGDAQVLRREVTDTDEVGGDEGVLEGHEDVEGCLGVGEHVGWVEELGEG